MFAKFCLHIDFYNSDVVFIVDICISKCIDIQEAYSKSRFSPFSGLVILRSWSVGVPGPVDQSSEAVMAKTASDWRRYLGIHSDKSFRNHLLSNIGWLQGV